MGAVLFRIKLNLVNDGFVVGYRLDYEDTNKDTNKYKRTSQKLFSDF